MRCVVMDWGIRYMLMSVVVRLRDGYCNLERECHYGVVGSVFFQSGARLSLGL